MALIKCKECGQDVSQKARNCPKCGAPIKKKTSIVSLVIAVIVGFWLIALIVNHSDTPSRSASAPTQAASSNGTITAYNLGQTAHVGYTTYAVWRAFYRDRLSDNEYSNEKPDAAYLFVELTVRNDDKQARTIAPFKLIDETNSEFETTSKAWRVDGGIGMLDSLNPGVEKRGFIVFDVPQGKHYKLVISGGYWSKDKAVVELGL